MKELFYLSCFLLIISVTPTALVDQKEVEVEEECFIVINETVSKYENTWTCNTLNCTYEILPRENYSIRLQYTNAFKGSRMYVAFNLYETYLDPVHVNQTSSIMKAHTGAANTHQIFTTKVGNGMMLHLVDYANGFCKRWKTFPSFSFERISDKSKIDGITRFLFNFGICDPMFVTVGNKVEIVQKRRRVEVREDCPYQLMIEPNRTHYGDTLYIYNSGIQGLWQTYEHIEELPFLTVVPNWTAVEVVSAYPKLKNSYYTPAFSTEIKAISSNRTCACGNAAIFVADGKTVTVRNPGFPDFLCPYIKCPVKLFFAARNIPQGHVSRVLVSFVSTAIPEEKTNLKMETDSLHHNFNSSAFLSYNSSFLMTDEDIALTWTSEDAFPVTRLGHFEMNVTRVYIPRNCDCSTLFEKAYNPTTTLWSTQIVIPAECDLMYCEWNVYSTDDHPAVEVTVDINQPTLPDTDEVLIHTATIMEKYTGAALFHRRKMIIPDAHIGGTVSFLRKRKGEELTLGVSFVLIDPESSCDEPMNFVISENKNHTIISPNYPNPYFAMHTCDYVFEAPKGDVLVVYIDDLNLENHHDHLQFFDGNSTEADKIKRFTGTAYDEIVKSTGNQLLVKFNSDAGGPENRGFHFIVYSEKPSSSGFWKFVIIFLVVFIIAVVVIGLKNYKKYKSNRASSYDNELVRFESDNGSSVTIMSS